jgi:uncharacterized protein
MNFDVDKRTVYKCIHGSRAYGTNTENSDTDIKGIAIPPKETLLGFDEQFDQYEAMAHKGHENDTVIYSIIKFAKLAIDNNPNIIEVLFVDESDILFIDEFGQRLRDIRYEFLSKNARFRFAGFAYSQLKRIKTHRSWLLNPPTHEPNRKEFNLPETMKISQSDLGAYDSLIEKDGVIELPHDIVKLFCAEKAYQSAKTHWDQYQNWRNTRNKSRAELEAKYFYDVKHGAHLIRLLRMCKEILTIGDVLVKRPDREELLFIRNGGWSYEQLIEEAEKIDNECKLLYETSTLQHTPNRKKLNKIVVEIVEEYLRKHG